MMVTAARCLAAIAVVVACGAAAGCNTSNNAALCFEMEDTVNARVEECFPGELPVRFTGMDDEGNEFGCESVNRVVAAGEITHQCLPWLIDASCTEIGAPSGWPDYCNITDHFIFVETTITP
jgi:hypothetical protein